MEETLTSTTLSSSEGNVNKIKKRKKKKIQEEILSDADVSYGDCINNSVNDSSYHVLSCLPRLFAPSRVPYHVPFWLQAHRSIDSTSSKMDLHDHLYPYTHEEGLGNTTLPLHNAIQNDLRIMAKDICKQVGYDRAHSGTIDIIACIASTYILHVGNFSTKLAEHASRTNPNLHDVSMALLVEMNGRGLLSIHDELIEERSGTYSQFTYEMEQFDVSNI